MNLYHVQYDDQPYYVEAPSFAAAIVAWRTHVADEWGDDFEGTEEPESVAVIHDRAVIRASADLGPSGAGA